MMYVFRDLHSSIIGWLLGIQSRRWIINLILHSAVAFLGTSTLLGRRPVHFFLAAAGSNRRKGCRATTTMVKCSAYFKDCDYPLSNFVYQTFDYPKCRLEQTYMGDVFDLDLFVKR